MAIRMEGEKKECVIRRFHRSILRLVHTAADTDDRCHTWHPPVEWESWIHASTEGHRDSDPNHDYKQTDHTDNTVYKETDGPSIHRSIRIMGSNPPLAAKWGPWASASLTVACGALAWNSGTVSVLWRERFWVDADMKRRYRDGLNEFMN